LTTASNETFVTFASQMSFLIRYSNGTVRTQHLQLKQQLIIQFSKSINF